MKDKIKFVAFDADDTLWENELYFQEFEQEFCKLLGRYMPADSISRELFDTEMKNLYMYGYGLKSMMLSMIETACRISAHSVDIHCIEDIIKYGQELLQRPVALLEGVEEVLLQLRGKYKLVLATKGDLFDQKRKVVSSGLQECFFHIEIMTDKKCADYQKLLAHLGCQPEEFLMIGNSAKSDILPVLKLGGCAAHVPHHITWAHEQLEGKIDHPDCILLGSIREILPILDEAVEITD